MSENHTTAMMHRIGLMSRRVHSKSTLPSGTLGPGSHPSAVFDLRAGNDVNAEPTRTRWKSLPPAARSEKPVTGPFDTLAGTDAELARYYLV